MNNPLLEPGELPAFSRIEPGMIQPAIETLIAANRERIAELTSQPRPTWDSLVKPLELLNDRLDRAWSPVRHLNSVKSSPEWRAAYEACLPLLSEYATELSQNRALFEAYTAIAESPEFARLDAARQKTLRDALRDFRLGGVELEGESRRRYQHLQKDLARLQSAFENNLLDSTQSWQYLIEDEARLAGLPGYARDMLRQLAAQKELPGYRVTLDMPSYLAVMTHADDRELRRIVYEAYATRASDHGITDKKWDNARNMVDIVGKRQEKAHLLGFASYADYSLETKMAASVDQVVEFLLDLAERSRPQARDEVAERQQFAESLGFDGPLAAWDWAYYSEKLRQHRYRVSDEELKPYFAEHRVVSGLFEIVSRLYPVTIAAR